MSKLSPARGTADEGRADQTREMLQALAGLEAKYAGVRGALLVKVRQALSQAARSQGGGSYDEGREAQYRALLLVLAGMEAKYGGVRGALLARVREELSRVRPTPTTVTARPSPARAASTPPAEVALPPCRVCGRAMKANGAAGGLICQNGHTRLM